MRAADERLARQPDMQAALSDEAADARWQRLQARLDAEGLLTSPPQPAAPTARPSAVPPGGWRRWLAGLLPSPRWPAAAALALVVIAGTVIVPVWMNDRVYDPPGELKGADDVRRVPVPRPREAAESFAAELTRAGLRPGLFQRGKSFIVDIDVDRPLLPAASPAFVRIGLEPRLGFTRVEFDPAP